MYIYVHVHIYRHADIYAPPWYTMIEVERRETLMNIMNGSVCREHQHFPLNLTRVLFSFLFYIVQGIRNTLYHD